MSDLSQPRPGGAPPVAGGAGVASGARRSFTPPSMGSLRPYAVLVRLSLALGAALGFGFGLFVILVLAFRLPVGLSWPVLVQVHGQGQILGFVALLIFAVGTVLFPRFLASPLRGAHLCLIGGGVVATSVVLRALAQPLPPSLARSALLLLGGVLAPIGLALFATPVARAVRQTIQPWQLWQSYAACGFGLLLASLLLGVWASAVLAGGLPLVPVGLNESMLHLQLHGFVVLIVLAVALKVFPSFLILRPPRERAFHPLLALYVGGVAVSAAGWLVQDAQPAASVAWGALRALGAVAEAIALVGYVAALRLYEPELRPSGRPHITVPTRLWFRLAFGFLLLAMLAAAFYGVREVLGGAGAGFAELNAIRHALAMGFLLPLIAGMAGRILPVYSADVLRRRWLLPTTVWLSFAGAAARVGGEWVGGYEPWIAPVVALGGVLSTTGFLIMAVALWHATGRLPDGS